MKNVMNIVDSDTLVSEVVHVGPRDAAFLLEGNTENFRPVSKDRVKRYALMMKEGNWELNGETIKISGDNKILDGQHRLHAVIAAGVTVPMLIIYGIEASARNIDQGMTRSASQWLAHKGYKNTIHLASAARLVIQHEAGLWDTALIPSYLATVNEITRVVEQSAGGLSEAIKLGKRVNALCSQSIASTVAYLGAADGCIEHDEMVQWFYAALAEGENLSEGEPVHTLRRMLIKNKTESAKRLPAAMLRWYFTMAWNATVQGRELHRLSLRMTGPNKQQPPTRVMVSTESA